MGQRIYTANFENITVSAIQDILSIKAGAANGIELHTIELSAAASSSTPSEIRLRLKRITGTLTAGTGGTAPAASGGGAPAVRGELFVAVVGAAVSGTSDTLTNPGGWSTPFNTSTQTGPMIGGGTQIGAAAAPSYSSGTLVSTSAPWAVILAGFKPATVYNNPLKVYKRR